MPAGPGGTQPSTALTSRARRVNRWLRRVPQVTYARGMGRARGAVPLSLLALVLAACSASGSAEP
ncbi:hypothetical protein, partial [Mycobacterium tuberculosis]